MGVNTPMIARLGACIVFMALIAGCEEPSEFERTFAEPDWFDSIDAPKINTVEEVNALWQSEKRCCEDANVLLRNNRIFYKSCFNAIMGNYGNEELVVKCLWLMDIGADSKQRVELKRYLVENYGLHKNSVDNCANCMPGDTVARVTLELSRYESRANHSKTQPIKRLENLLDSRLYEISYWVQAEIYEYLGVLYLESGVTQERLSRYEESYNRLNKAKQHNGPLERSFARVEKRYNLLVQETTEKQELSNTADSS
jgi:hypothetical protein